VESSLAGPDLEQLLAQLLRLLSRDALTGAQSSRATAKENTGEQAAPLPAVSASEARALIALLAARGIAQGQLAEALGLEKSTVSRLAAGLERKGWIRRGRDEGNHRYVRLYLTPQGGLVAGRVWQALQSLQARILAGLSAEEREGLAIGLRGLVRELVAEGILDGAPTAPSAPSAPSAQVAPAPSAPSAPSASSAPVAPAAGRRC
jgi:DNA-binding MarR family transcriptional regulator